MLSVYSAQSSQAPRCRKALRVRAGDTAELCTSRGGHCGGLTMWGCWCGAAVPACCMRGRSLRLWRWEAQGSTRIFLSAGSLLREYVPSGSCPPLQHDSRQPSACSSDRLSPSSSAAWKQEQMGRAYSQEIVICFHDPGLLWQCTNEGWALWQAKSADFLREGFGKINALLVFFGFCFYLLYF